MISRTRPLLALGAATVLLTVACGSSTTDDGTVADEPSTVSASTDTSTAEPTDVDPTVLFDDEALTEVPTVVDCTLSTGTETTCYQY
ncbi:hypothetical protein, partial [Nocardioides sp.]|uniref:hypothetical protein n=1 Tax=Nocardioides sp. TaxID=35761 RepID=UPI002B26508E